MGYLEKFVTIRHLIIFALIGWTFTSAEAPLQSYGSPKSSWTMMKSDMVHAYSTVEREPMASSRVDTFTSPGWTPYQSSPSSPSYQRSYRTLMTPAQSFERNSYAPPPSNPRPIIDSYSQPPSTPSVSSFPSTSYRAVSQDSEPELVKSATSYYGTPSAPASLPASSYAPAPSSSYGEASPGSSYGPYTPAEKEVRFVIHKDGEEDQVRNTILMQFGMDDNISFLNGPMFKLQKKQKLFLPPKPKTIVYVLLRQPEVNTETEVIPSTDDPKPEVRIIYQKPEGVQTKHYSPDSHTAPKPSGY